MALEWKRLDIPLTGGMSDDMDDNVLPKQRFTKVEGLQQDKTGRLSHWPFREDHKRAKVNYKTQAVGEVDYHSITGVDYLIDGLDSVTAVVDIDEWSHKRLVSARTDDNWKYIRPYQGLSHEVTRLESSDSEDYGSYVGDMAKADSGIYTDNILQVWRTGGASGADAQLHIRWLGPTGDERYKTTHVISPTTYTLGRIRVAWQSATNQFYIIFHDTLGNNLYYTSVGAGDYGAALPAFAAKALPVYSVNPDFWDVAGHLLVMRSNLTTIQVVDVSAIDTTLIFLTPSSAPATRTGGGVFLDEAASRLYVVYALTSPATTLEMKIVNTTTWTLVSTVTALVDYIVFPENISLAKYNDGTNDMLTVLVDVANSFTGTRAYDGCVRAFKFNITTGAFDVSTPDSIYNTRLASRAFSVGENVWAWVRAKGYGLRGAAWQNYTYLLRSFSAFSPAGEANHHSVQDVLFPSNAGGVSNTTFASVLETTDNQHLCMLAESASLEGIIDENTATVVPVACDVRLNFTAKLGYEDKTEFLYHGGLRTLQGLDRPYGFPIAPILLNHTETAGGTVDVGTFSYLAVLSYRDRRGEIHLSAPSEPRMATIVSGIQTVNFIVGIGGSGGWSEFNSADGPRRFQVQIYRTAIGGAVFRRTATESVVYAEESITGSFIESDAAIEDNELLYTTGGVYANTHPPAGLAITTTAAINRLWIASADNPREVWFSKEKRPGEAYSFNSAFKLKFSRDVTQLASYLDRVIVFFESGISTVSGVGPSSAGNGRFPPPQALSFGIGAKKGSVVVNTPLGVVFQSGRGIELLDRSMTVQYIGGPVEDSFSGVLKSAQHRENAQQVWLLCEADNLIYVWDYKHNTWTVENPLSYTISSLASDDGGVVASFNHSSVFSTIKYNDDATFTSVTNPAVDESGGGNSGITTGWIALNGLSGYQRIRKLHLLLKYQGDSDVVVKVYSDGDESTVDQTLTFNVTSPTAGDTFNVVGHIENQKCRSIKFAITQVATGLTPGVEFLNLSLEYGAKRTNEKIGGTEFRK